jgi:hypothetical protein
MLQALQDTIENAAHLLPAQGPITVFIHHLPQFWSGAAQFPFTPG